MDEKVTLKDIEGIIETPVIKGRFQEIISTQKIVDTYTDTEYNGQIDTELLELINELDDENQRLQRQIIDTVKHGNELPCNCNPCVMQEEITKILFDEKIG